MADKPGSSANEFLNQFLKGTKVRMDPESRNTIHHDKWDQEDFNAIAEELRELPQAQRDLLGITSTGTEAIEDAFFSLKKPVPEIKEDEEIRPSYMINSRVMEETMTLKEWDQMRVSSVADEVAAALAAVSMEPKLEVIFDRLKHEQELLEELQQQMMQAQGLQEEIDDAEEQIDKMRGESGGGGGQSSDDLKDQQEKAKEALEKLKKSMQEKADEIDQGMEEKLPEVRTEMREALQKANEQQGDMEDIQKSWGLETGGFYKLPAKRRIELAKRVNTEHFRRMAKVFGSIMRLAIAEQQKKTLYAKNQVCDIHLGNDITHVLPTEFSSLLNPDMKLDFYRKYLARGLMQYKLEGEEKVAKGDIIYCADSSASMIGDPEVWSKAVGLALLNVARMQKRGFYGIHFGSPGEYVSFDFKESKVTETTYKGKVTEYDQIDGTLEYAEMFLNSGTDFMTPLTLGLAKLKEQHEQFGATKGDIVFATDGICGVEAGWLKEFKEEQKRLGFKVYGIILGGDPEQEPLREICDGLVFTTRSLIDGDGIKGILGGV